MQARPPVHAPKPDATAISADARYLLDVLASLKISPNRLADAINVPASTLSRHVPRADGTPKRNTPRTMHPEVRAKIEAFSGLSAPSHAAGAPAPAARRLRGFGEEAVPYDHTAPTADPKTVQIVRLLIRDRPNAFPMVVKTRMLEEAGYHLGDIVIVEQGLTPKPGQVVCAQLYDDRGGADTVLRIYRTVGPVRLLFGSPKDPAAEALLVDDEGERGAKIMSVVTESFRPRSSI